MLSSRDIGAGVRKLYVGGVFFKYNHSTPVYRISN